ncbi:lipoyl(octanoyl) transferase LipB [Candidatus Cardinium hertigii]|uniref:Octanoyltransferase n=1 Tax=Candidatus Cardinium hertigii TaxID=247481 RepID=A0A2Z3LHQ1_9BACT|nr:lipoyl(octanoyl) transferase LipB [Candidatus Cardinium hertigii]AWN81974.1 Octanoyltransferase [Candidatus Cardinium hertigii]
MIRNKAIGIKSLGLISYETAYRIQELYYKNILEKKKNGFANYSGQCSPNYLLFCEHPPTYTIGSSGSTEQLLVDTVVLKKQSIALYQTNRGGGITYHGPGQLIAYFIIDLENFFTSIDRYLRLLEEAVIETLAYFHIIATQLPGLTGVWIKAANTQPHLDSKICSIGIRVSRWITMHGLALNVNNDLEPFKQIIPCGISTKKVTSIQQEIQRTTCIKRVTAVLEKIILEKFYYS